MGTEKQRLVRRLESIAEISEVERQALIELPMTVRDVQKGADIVREGDRPSECCLVLEGFVCRYKILAEGKRQILSFHPPGDIPDLQSLHLKTMDHSLGALTPTRAGFIAHSAMANLIDRHPRLGALFWRETLIDAAIFREWMVGLGRQTAIQRVAHVICEMAMRCRAVGLADERSFVLPVTQTELGDALGLSTVHVNRVLRELREADLAVMRTGTVTVLDWEGLRQMAEFDPGYLHLREEVQPR
ncbi:Crp/Fnr family transcriptional regulator [Faunimonas sp. B44]|uniref:Crp/Fnr family transcriptional regulator n=1 Tax=Faunimonas sp. B44 TaxID=3461493 RepID=UPI0040447FAD